VENTVADGLLLIGDAAGFTSPMFEGGTGLAMTSGKFAAQVAAEALQKGDTSKAALSRYETLWRNEFPDYSRLVASKDAVYRFNDEEWNRMGHLIPKNLTAVSALDKVKVGLNVTARAPALWGKGFAAAMDALGYSRAKHYGW